MTTQTTDFPWTDLNWARAPDEFVTLQVPEEANPNGRKVFWGRSFQGHPVLLVEYQSEPWRPVSLPRLENIKVSDYKEKRSLTIELLDVAMSELFLKVGLDIVDALQEVSPRSSRQACIYRLERWSSFLKPSRAKLSEEAQKGLIAELWFLQRDVAAVHGADSALRCWVGPEGAQRDFALGQVFVEVKSKRSSANSTIVISSEDQLNVNSTERLFLFVAELNRAASDDRDSFTISDIVQSAKSDFSLPLQTMQLERKLAAVGYFEEDDYSETRWTEGGTYYYEVRDGFPKIDSKSCPVGVSRISYHVDLDYCDDFRVDRDAVLKAME